MRNLKFIRTVCKEMEMTPEELKVLIDKGYVKKLKVKNRWCVDINELKNFYLNKIRECRVN